MGLKILKMALVGTVGIAAGYGGFETLAENLVKYHDASLLPDPITVSVVVARVIHQNSDFM